MRKKIISGFLAFAMVFTSVQADVTALSTWGNSVERQNINSSAFGSTNTGAFGGTTSSTNAFGGSTGDGALNNNFPTSGDAFSSGAFSDTNNSSAFDVYNSYNESTNGSTSLGGSFGNSLTNGGVFEYLADSNVATPTNDIFGESSVPSNSTTETSSTIASNSSNTTDVPTAIPEAITDVHSVSGQITVPTGMDKSDLKVQLYNNTDSKVEAESSLAAGGNLTVPVPDTTPEPEVEPEVEQDETTEATGLEITGDTSATVGDTKNYTATVVPTNASVGAVSWSGNNDTVATITTAGVLTAKSQGTVTITATANDTTTNKSVTGTKIITINVEADPFVAITGITISGDTTVEEGSTLSLSTSIAPTNATNKDATVSWSVSGESIATINSSGVLTPSENIAWGTDETPKTVEVTATITPATDTTETVTTGTASITITKKAAVEEDDSEEDDSEEDDSEEDDSEEDDSEAETAEPEVSKIDDLQSFFSQMTNSNSAFGVAPMAISTPNITIEDNTDNAVATIDEYIQYTFTNVPTGSYTIQVVNTTSGKTVASSSSLNVTATMNSVNLSVPVDGTTVTGSASISGKVTAGNNNVTFTNAIATLYKIDSTGASSPSEVSSKTISYDSDANEYSYAFTSLAGGMYYVIITGDYIEDTQTATITLNDEDEKDTTTVIYPKKYELKYGTNYNTANGTSVETVKVEMGTSNIHVVLGSTVETYIANQGQKFSHWVVKYNNIVQGEANIRALLGVTADVTSSGIINESFSFTMPAGTVEFDIVTEDLGIDVHSVKFSTDNASSTTPNTQSVKDGRYVTEPNQPIKNGYTFQGWYTTATGTTKWNFDTNTVTEDMTLYARWVGNTVKVKMNIQSGDSIVYKTEVSANVGEQLTINGSAIKPDGYYFSYWYWGYDYSDAYNQTYSMESNDWCGSHISMNTTVLIPPMVNGAELNLYSVWVPLTALIYIDGIESPDTSGDSCVVTITSADYGTQEGIYYPSSSYYGGEAYAFDLSSFGTGMYTVDVATSSGQEMVDVIYIKEDSLNYHTISLLPAGKIASVSNTSSVPNVGTSNISEMFSSSELSSDNEVIIELQVSNVSSNANEIEFIKENLSSTQTVGLYVDITLYKNDGGTKYTMSELPGTKGLNIVFDLPDSFKDQNSYFVATVHDGTYSTINSANVSYDSSSNSISFYTKELSVYAIGYKGSSSTGSTSTGTGSTGSTGGVGNGIDIPTADGYSVPLFQNVMVGQWIEGLGKYQLVHPEPNLWKFAGWYYGETGIPLSQTELDTYFVVTQAIMDYGIFPRFVAIDEDGNPLTTPVPSTGNSFQAYSEYTLLSLI